MIGARSMANIYKSRQCRMVITRTPLRVSFVGGGTDLAAFYESTYGAVLSTAINKYIYVTVKRHSDVFDEPIRLNYSISEQVQKIDEIENDIARECLKFLNIEPPLYISTVGDLPASSGLGGSSSFAVGLLNALHAFKGDRVSAGQLAEEASFIEIGVLKEPIGKQDQYAAAFGGLNCFCFKSGGGVTVEPVPLNNGMLKTLFNHVLTFWTGHTRDASSVLSMQKKNTTHNMELLMKMRDQVHELQNLFSHRNYDVRDFGRILDEGWQLKRGLAENVSTKQIDEWYFRARKAGAWGGKLCGAGGGGFLLFVLPPEHKDQVRHALLDLKEVPVEPEVHGSQVIFKEG